MKLKEKISIDEFDGKRFQIRLVEAVPANHKKAVITHYLHNIDNGVAKHFKQDAMKYLKEYVQFQEEENNLSMVAEDALQQLLFEVNDVPFPTPENYTFKFIDLFAGIGGFRMAMQNLGGKCVFTSEWDKEAQRTYRANFGEVPFGDITKEQTKKFIPDGFDVLGVPLSGRAFRCNLFARSSQKRFPLQSLTQKAA
jgi:DNA (cytosine-5)-methyltransferase 1